MTKTILMTLGAAAILVIPAGASADDAPTPAKQVMTTAATQAAAGPGYVDNDGDGICDNYQARQGQRGGRGQGRAGARGGHGPGDGTGNQGVGPKDGTGYGPGPGTNCDGTGPKGTGRRAGRR